MDDLQEYTAKTFVGLERILEKELQALGATNTRRYSRAVAFEGNLELIYRANFQLRTALRILHPLGRETVRNQDQLYAFAHRLNWLRWFRPDQTFAITAKVINAPAFNNSTFVALKVKDAIADQFRRIMGSRPSVDKDNPNVRIDVFLYKDQCTISIDSSGESLHRRGYRTKGHRAPLNEVLAAGMIQLSGWTSDTTLVDPFCGTGTLLTEAALLAGHIAPNIKRENFGFQHWKNYNEKLWEKAWLDCRAQERRWKGISIGGDISGKVLSFAQDQIKRAGVAPNVQLHHAPFTEFPFPEAPFTLVTNPPYGERLDRHEVEGLYQQIGDRLKADARGSQAWILSSVDNFHRFIGLRPSERILLYNGGLDCQFMQFELYSGSRREASEPTDKPTSIASDFTNKKKYQPPRKSREQSKYNRSKSDKNAYTKDSKRTWKEDRASFDKKEQPRRTGGKRWRENRASFDKKEDSDTKRPWKKGRPHSKKPKKWNKGGKKNDD